jgi:ABC-type uncharacterized transport system permease subunit
MLWSTYFLDSHPQPMLVIISFQDISNYFLLSNIVKSTTKMFSMVPMMSKKRASPKKKRAKIYKLDNFARA